jgi:hypothetical protein
LSIEGGGSEIKGCVSARALSIDKHWKQLMVLIDI